MEFKDYYKIMGVEPSASPEEIKRVYRRLARKYHPDVSTEADAEARFKEVGEAYEVLRDPQKREQYDQLRARGFRGGEEFRPPPDWRTDFDFHGFEDRGFESGSGFSDFFESLFGGARRQRPRGRRGSDLRARIEIDLENAFSGGVQRVQFERVEVGPDGTLRKRPESLEVRIPAGVTDGRTLRLKGRGEAAPGGTPGDLFLEVRIRPHRLFELDGRDVHLTLPVAPWEAALGARVSVPTLKGRVEMNIPAGSGSGKRLRLKGRGLPGTGKLAGDQYVTLKVVAPKAVSEHQRRAVEALRDAFPDFNPRSQMEKGRTGRGETDDWKRSTRRAT